MNAKKKAIIVTCIVVVVLVTAGFTVPVVAVPYEVTTEIQGTETYTEKEPYENTETYIVNEPYQATQSYNEQVPLNYQEIQKYDTKGFYSKRSMIIIGDVVFQDKIVTIYYPITCVDLKNTDDTAGDYSISFYLTATTYDQSFPPLLGGTYTKHCSIQMESGETKTFKSEFEEVDLSRQNYTWTYSVNAGTKIIPKERIVTKYKDVEKTRTVTLYRDVKKTRPITIPSTETRYKKVPLILSWFD